MCWCPFTLGNLSPAAPAAQEVHLWAWEFSRITTTAEDRSLLSPSELKYLNRLPFEFDQDRYLASHSTLRRLLSSYVDQAPAEIRFDIGACGKPFICLTDHDLQFNLSHSASTGVLAVAKGIQLGVDVEDVHEIDIKLNSGLFSAAEQREFSQLSGNDSIDAFFRCWTRKEAILKAEGIGLNVSLDSFDVSLTADAPATLLQYSPASNLSRSWKLYHLQPSEKVIGALATDQCVTIQYFQLVEEDPTNDRRPVGIDEG